MPTKLPESSDKTGAEFRPKQAENSSTNLYIALVKCSTGGLKVKRAHADVDRLVAELMLDSATIDELCAQNERAAERIDRGASDDLDYAALGYTIHNIYGVIENACYRISKFFENGLSADSWHKDLLNRMLLDIPGTRPAFFTRNEFLILDDLRAFRHVFRNLYGRPLDRERLQSLQKKTKAAIPMFRDAVRRYAEFLKRLGDSIEE